MNIINFVLCGSIGVKTAGSAEPVLLVLTDIQTDTDLQYTHRQVIQTCIIVTYMLH